jgi:hypothetical protein
MTIKHVVFDHGLPLSDSAAAGADHRTMTDGELLAALLITDLEGQGNAAAIALVRDAMALPACRRMMRAEDLPAIAFFR